MFNYLFDKFSTIKPRYTAAGDVSKHFSRVFSVSPVNPPGLCRIWTLRLLCPPPYRPCPNDSGSKKLSFRLHFLLGSPVFVQEPHSFTWQLIRLKRRRLLGVVKVDKKKEESKKKEFITVEAVSQINHHYLLPH